MSETRALRDKLEETQAELRRTKAHLEKLRAHHAREQEALREELEAARREVARLGVRLQELETLGHELPLEALPASLEALLPERSLATSTALVALVRQPASMEGAIPALSRVLRLSAVDLRLRLAAMPPIVLARVALSEVEALQEALRAEGFVTVSREVPPRMGGGMMTVRRFTLEERGMVLDGTRGERQQVLYPELRLLVRGRRIQAATEARAERGAEAELAGFVMMGVEAKQEQYGQFLWAYGEGVRVAFSRETGFAGLGAQRGLSSFDSLQRLMEELRGRAPQVVIDERFMKAPRFSLPLVEEERSHELFADLLDQAVQEGLWP
ncbi:MAG: hypothetical protein JXB05_14530 [Myxococcaceae bacterium]|nr:hypothetical protein [Myxococcaceae bacterium]